ncbi:chemotaxis protein CheC [Geomonas sp. Red69]|uniref:chemotaxis protein CheC n=1 Tax=Geomonas diazotrophica TaxID=2843197 RepID=UPI001C0FF783|nr:MULTISPECIES: chemotaxis protein CheC [Geomonas]MBU5635686.1 chemotaxis protein CheC [Geomonas diazotrophica]QXE87206.1 chemotaxis protein CheC [Geomonas nitrogeniifigens]
MAHQDLHDGELKALTQVCNTGMQHAAVALSQLMGKGVSIQVPRLQVLDGSALPHLLESQEATALQLQILGNVRGSIIILLLQENAHRILELLLGKLPKEGEPLSEMERATLMEVGNILASACLNALGNSLKMTLLPSVPALSTGQGSDILARALDRGDGDEVVVMMDAMFSVSDSLCGGSIFLIPAPASLGVLLGALEQ